DAGVGVVVSSFGFGFGGPCGCLDSAAVVLAFDDDSGAEVSEAGDVAAVFGAAVGAAFDAVVDVLVEVVGDGLGVAGAGVFCGASVAGAGHFVLSFRLLYWRFVSRYS